MAATTPPESATTHKEPNWERIEQAPEFRSLIRSKVAFVVPACVFFCVYYFLLPVLVGYFPALMEKRVVGAINVAYLFALSQFFMAWTIMILYVRKARTFDAYEAQIKDKVLKGELS